ncbi:MAG: hypothetical protein ACLU37_11405 [Collinsella sp.]
MNLSKPKINALLALALFTFAFLAAEFRFDINVGLLTGAERVVIAQGFILGASVIGFIGYAPLLGLAQRKGHSLAAANAAVPIAIRIDPDPVPHGPACPRDSGLPRIPRTRPVRRRSAPRLFVGIPR